MNREQDRIAKRWESLAVTGSLILILTTTLYPYSFHLNVMHEKLGRLILSELTEIHFLDILINIILFVPMGFSLTHLLKKRGQRDVAVLVDVLLVSFLLSTAVEISQFFLPSRIPSLIDVLTNGLGGVSGFVCCSLYEGEIFDTRVEKILSVRKLMLGFFGYATVVFLISIPLQRATNLSNWDLTFPLLLGNEKTGDRPWHGRIYQVQIANRAISEQEVAHAFRDQGAFASIGGNLLCSFQFRDGKLFDKQSGLLPEIVWKGGFPDGSKEALVLSDSYWLETSAPALELSRAIRRTNQFTLSATVAPLDLSRNGPARIISLSADPHHRNFTLGQEEGDLVFRLRTPLTGENGTNHELIVPEVFTTNEPRHLVVTYDGSVLVLYLDGVRHSKFLELGPGANLSDPRSLFYACERRPGKILYYGLVFSPLGCLLALIVRRLRWPSGCSILVLAIGVCLPPYVLEKILVLVSGKFPSLENSLLGGAVTAGTVVLFGLISQLRAVKRGRRNTLQKEFH